MVNAWVRLKTCWALPDGDDAHSRALLLDRQLRNLFRVIPAYAVANGIGSSLLFVAIWPRLEFHSILPWLVLFAGSHAGWVLHALRRSMQNHRPGSHGLGIRDLHVSAFWCALTALAWSIGLYYAAPLATSDGTRSLLAAYVPGLIATGVLVGITTPLISAIWLSMLTAAACLIILRQDYLLHGPAIAELLLYATMLSVGLLAASRTFIARISAELLAERNRQVVDLLLGDFEANASDWLWESDVDGRITRAGARLAAVLGLDEAGVRGAHLASLFAKERLLTVASDGEVGGAALTRRLAAGSAFRSVIVEAEVDAVSRSWRLSAKPLRDGKGHHTGWRGVGSEVSDARARELERTNRERYLHHLATHDALSGLPNRRAFLERIGHLRAASAAIAETSHAVALIDLDNFKAVNDALGHSVGDVVLQHVADHLRGALRPGDFLARLGGDEFAMLIRDLPATDTVAQLEQIAERIVERLRLPETVKRYRIDIRGSVGLVHTDGTPRPNELMRRADIALYAAKAAGRDTYRIYTGSMGTSLKHRLSLVSDLSLALERHEFHLVYQCIVDLDTLEVVGCEALLRWQHPQHGAISPLDFIPAAEESGLIVPIGLWVVEEACRAAAAWPEHVRIAINLSAVQLGSTSVAASIADRIGRSGIAPGRVELEITESTVARDRDTALDVLHQLCSAGMRLAMDDFGTGYSSMAQLHQLPFHTLKLDRSFVAGLGGDHAEAARSIIAAMLHLSDLMGLSLTAEGVETLVELESLRKLGCRHAQGYLFAKPADKEKVALTIAAGRVLLKDTLAADAPGDSKNEMIRKPDNTTFA